MKFFQISGIVFFFLFLLPAAFLRAQTADTNPQIFITWQADNFYPSNYPLKSFSAIDGSVNASVMVIKNQKPVDLSGTVVTWLLDNKKITSGMGVQNVTFQASAALGDKNFLQALVLFDDGVVRTGVNIPVVRPMLVIKSPTINGSVPKNSALNLEAVPYFFNVASLLELTFRWTINGQATESSGNTAVLDVGSPLSAFQTSVGITVSATKITDQTEIGKGATSINITQ